MYVVLSWLFIRTNKVFVVIKEYKVEPAYRKLRNRLLDVAELLEDGEQYLRHFVSSVATNPYI